jgi:hypothetical protein
MLSFLAFILSVSTDPAFHSAAPARVIEQRHPVRITPQYQSPKTSSHSTLWNGHFSATTFRNTTTDRMTLLNIKRNLRKTLRLVPSSHSQALQDLEIRNLEHVSRGMANNEKIILHTQSIDTDDELISVFLHEIGHVVDLGYLEGKKGRATAFRDHNSVVLSDDPSFSFYRLSWIDSQTQKQNLKPHDFASGYAQQSCFEDFAESYLLYRLHGEKFRQKMKSSSLLRQKYSFFKTRVFEGQEFQLEKDSPLVSFPHIWDVTLLQLNS